MRVTAIRILQVAAAALVLSLCAVVFAGEDGSSVIEIDRSAAPERIAAMPGVVLW